ncbi:MAG: hypothetical protein R2932_32330 [Caldilineaceae bacterium]
MRIIDAHNHPEWHGHNLQKFLANMAQYTIERTWLLSWEAPPDEYIPDPYLKVSLIQDGYPLPFSNCLRYKEAAPDKFVLCYAPDPRRPDAIDQLQAAIDLHGVQVYGELKLRMMYDNLDALRLYRFCGEKGCRWLCTLIMPSTPANAIHGPTGGTGVGSSPLPAPCVPVRDDLCRPCSRLLGPYLRR